MQPQKRSDRRTFICTVWSTLGCDTKFLSFLLVHMQLSDSRPPPRLAPPLPGDSGRSPTQRCLYNVSQPPFLNNMQVGYKETKTFTFTKRSLIALQFVIEINEMHSLIRGEKKDERKKSHKSISSNSKIIVLVYFMSQLHKPALFVCPSVRYLLCFCTKNKDAFINSQKSVGQTIHAVKPPKPLSANNEIHQ